MAEQIWSRMRLIDYAASIQILDTGRKTTSLVVLASQIQDEQDL
jgi:hypothetical protein